MTDYTIKADSCQEKTHPFFSRIAEFNLKFGLKHGVVEVSPGLFKCRCGWSEKYCSGNTQGKHPITYKTGQKKEDGKDEKKIVITDSLPDIQKHLAAGGNLGVYPAKGLFVIDIDSESAWDCFVESMGKVGISLSTFRCRTAKGWHFYYRAENSITPESDPKLFNFKVKQADGTEKYVIELKGANSVLNCPPSLHITGVSYQITNDVDIVSVSQAEIEKLITHLKPIEYCNYDKKRRFFFEGELRDKPSFAEIEKMVRRLPAEDDYHEWTRLAAAISNATNGSAEGRAIFENWSQLSKKYKKGDGHTKWRGVSNMRSITVGTLIRAAQNNGYEFPKQERIKYEGMRNYMPNRVLPMRIDSEGAEEGQEGVPPEEEYTVPIFSSGHYRNDKTETPPDLISPRIAIEGGNNLLCGSPKVGKSDLSLELVHCAAAGTPFLGMEFPRPLRIVYFQSEVKYHYLKERIKYLNFSQREYELIDKNLFISQQNTLRLDAKGCNIAIRSIEKCFPNPNELPDLIIFDPLRNVFDGGRTNANENDNTAMQLFLAERVQYVRDMVNPLACVMLVHHIRKVAKLDFQDDVFNTIAGAGSLRGWYDTGMILYREDEKKTERKLAFEIRNGPGLRTKTVDKDGGKWIQLPEKEPNRVSGAAVGERNDRERERKEDLILRLLSKEALKGELYIPSEFANEFDGRHELGARSGIIERINVLAKQGHIKYNKEFIRMGRSKTGIMVVEGMRYLQKTDTGDETISIPPTHYRTALNRILPMENPEIWSADSEDEDGDV